MTLCYRLSVAWTLIASLACAGARSHPARVRPERRDVLGVDEIRRDGSGTAYDVIRRLRPEFLSRAKARGVDDLPIVFLDGIRVGEIDVLRTIGVTGLREIRWLGPDEATLRFGTGYPAGAICVITVAAR